MEHPLNIIGPRVRAFRKAGKWTQEMIVARCQRLGLDITRGTLAKIESRRRTVSDHEVPFLARALRIKPGELFLPALIVLKRKIRNPHGARRR